MFCKHCHYEFYVPGETLGAKIRCPNCTGTLMVEDRSLMYHCPECNGMLEVALWMIGSAATCPHCSREIVLSLGEDSGKYFPDSPKQTAMLKTASRKAGDIIGKYRVIRCLGIGGMGEVYLVEHTLLNHRCALKLLKKAVAKDDPEMRARLLREARLASQIQHKNLIAVLDAELEEKSASCYIVMEYVDGVSIEHILNDGPMLEERALEIISEVAEALKVASEHKIIHRDIKPANIMLSSSGDIKVADLGIAKVESDGNMNVTLTLDNAVLGTPNYASPEQLRSSHQVDCRADIYSLGATLYHMLTGRRPFEAESVFGVMCNVLESELPMAHTVNPEISLKTSALISRMMAKKREERPADFDVLLKELKAGKKSSTPAFVNLKQLSSIFTAKRICSVIIAVVAIAGLVIAGKIFYDTKKADAQGKAGFINRQRSVNTKNNGRPRRNRYGYRTDRSLAELKREVVNVLATLDRANISNLRVVDFQNATRVASYIYHYDSAAGEIEQLDRAITSVFPEFFRYMVKRGDDNFNELFRTVAVVDGAALDTTWDLYVKTLNQNYIEAFAQDEPEKIDTAYRKLMEVDPNSPYRGSVSYYKQMMRFLRYGNLIEAKKYLEQCRGNADVVNALKKKLASYITMRSRRLNNFISNAIDRRYFYSAEKFIEELTQLGSVDRAEYWSKQLESAKSSRSDRQASETQSEALIFMAERGNSRAARELMSLKERPDNKVIDQLIKFRLQELENSTNKYVVAEDVSVISAFLEAGYAPGADLAEALRDNPLFSSQVLQTRKTPAVSVAPSESQTKRDGGDSGTDSNSSAGDTSAGDTAVDNNSGNVDPASSQSSDTASADNKFDESKLKFLLRDAVKDCNVRRLKYLSENYPAKLVNVNNCLAFVRAVLKLDYKKAKKIYDEFEGLPIIKNAMEVHLEQFDMVFSMFFSGFATRYPGRGGMTKHEVEACYKALRDLSDYSGSRRVEMYIRRCKANLPGIKAEDAPVDVRRYILGNPLMIKYLLQDKRNVNAQTLFDRYNQLLLKRSKSSTFDFRMWAIIMRFFDAGVKMSQELKDEFRKIPQYDDYFLQDDDLSNIKWEKINGSAHDIDFGRLTDTQRDYFTSRMLSNNLLQLDGVYPGSEQWKQKYGDAKHNRIPISKAAVQNFTVSIVFYPRSGGTVKYDKYSTVLALGRYSRYFVLTLPERKLVLSFKNFEVALETGFDVELDKWHSCQVVVSVPKKRVEVIFDGKYKRFTLDSGFQFMQSYIYRSSEDFSFTNYSSGRTFYGDVRHLRIYGYALTSEELKKLSGEIAEKFMGNKAVSAARPDTNSSSLDELIVQYKKADESRQRSLSSQIGLALIPFLKITLDHNVDACLDVVKKCENIKHNRDDAGWKSVCEIIQNAYISAVVDDDNKKVVKIYELWRAVDPVPAGNVHRMYTEFARAFWRCNLADAQKILKKYDNFSDKYLDPLKEKLNTAKSDMLSALVQAARGGRTTAESKAILSEMERIGASRDDIDRGENSLRKNKINRSLSRAEVRKSLFKAIHYGYIWMARMAIDSGAGRCDRESIATSVNGRVKRQLGNSAWDLLIRRIANNYYRRQVYIGILLLIMDRERLTAAEKREVEQIKQIADFILK
ncbi:MAG: hypothetical protein E7054_10605 [Lentisphaerae bacterium]|nr:hypothetical protein [Lentisphaerota bacterium]